MMNNRRFMLLSLAIFAVALFRLVPHLPNFTPVLAIALFGGRVIDDRRAAFLVPLAAMFVSDLLIGLHSQMVFVYAAFVAVVLLGGQLRRYRGWLPVAGATVAGSLLFFAVTNFGVWLLDGMYPLTGAGLLASYAAGLPFLQYSIAGNLFYVALLFGGYALLTRPAADARSAVGFTGQ